jgi:hypothetical protein
MHSYSAPLDGSPGGAFILRMLRVVRRRQRLPTAREGGPGKAPPSRGTPSRISPKTELPPPPPPPPPPGKRPSPSRGSESARGRGPPWMGRHTPGRRPASAAPRAQGLDPSLSRRSESIRVNPSPSESIRVYTDRSESSPDPSRLRIPSSQAMPGRGRGGGRKTTSTIIRFPAASVCLSVCLNRGIPQPIY